MESKCLVLFTKPAEAGRVKTRLIGDLTAEQAALLQAALRDDSREALARGSFTLKTAWALDAGQSAPGKGESVLRQGTGDLGEKMFEALATAGLRYDCVAVAGSDRPGLDAATVERAFELLGRADLVLEPAFDGGYSLIALRATALDCALFADVAWSTGAVLGQTLDRAARLGLRVELLPPASDLDTPADLARLCQRLNAGENAAGPRTSALLASWGRVAAPVRA